MMKSFLGIALGFGISAAFAGTLTTPLPGSLWVANDNTQQTAIGPTPVGNTTPTKPSWAVVQWSTRDPVYSPGPFRYPYKSIPYSSFQGSNDLWTLSNSTAAVIYDKVNAPWLNGVYTLSLNGVPTLACGDEYDLLLQPKGPLSSYGPNAAGSPDGIQVSKPLANLSSLSFSGGVEASYEEVQFKCPSTTPFHLNNATYVVGLFLKNTHDGKNFFYQIFLRDSRITNPTDLGVDLEGFTDGVSIGVNDSIRRISPASPVLIPNGGRVAYMSVNILPRLGAVLSRGWIVTPAGSTFTYDNNLNNWRVEGVYIGNMVYGGAIMSSKWDNFNLIETP
ncbi:hypothetical protein [Delftia acidovorans]|uniref:hypothetical protein n=1 Tax=Delftia acidovorans TaxID=80866 RepID=UPI0028B15440|nr:hypothetical protein [Delftia acidovorans]